MEGPRRIWWARPRKLCLLERPGGGGRSHRPQRRATDIAHLAERGVRLVVSTMVSRHNLPDYERAGLQWRHLPVASCADGAEALDALLTLLRRELRLPGAIAVHGNRQTDFVAALGAAHLHATLGTPLEAALSSAARAGLAVSEPCAALLGVDYAAVQPRSAMAASTSPGRSVTT